MADDDEVDYQVEAHKLPKLRSTFYRSFNMVFDRSELYDSYAWHETDMVNPDQSFQRKCNLN